MTSPDLAVIHVGEPESIWEQDREAATPQNSRHVLKSEYELACSNMYPKWDKFHRKTGRTIIRQLKRKGIETTYGRAAKIIAVYIKTAIIIRDSGKSALAKIAHPPIDNILLTNLNKTNKNLGLSGIKWTLLTEKEYFGVITKLRTLNLKYFWELEKHWTPVQKG